MGLQIKPSGFIYAFLKATCVIFLLRDPQARRIMDNAFWSTSKCKLASKGRGRKRTNG